MSNKTRPSHHSFSLHLARSVGIKVIRIEQKKSEIGFIIGFTGTSYSKSSLILPASLEEEMVVVALVQSLPQL